MVEEEEEQHFYSDQLHNLLPGEILQLILSKISNPKALSSNDFTLCLLFYQNNQPESECPSSTLLQITGQ